MPELPEVETIVVKLRQQIIDQTIVSVDVLWERTVDRPSLPDFYRILTGASINRLKRRGKFIIFGLSNGYSLLVHLRMSGKFLFHSNAIDADEQKHTRLRLHLNDGSVLVYIDQRKFGRFYLVEHAEEITGDLGPEPLSETFTPAWLQRALSERRGEIKRLLLNQRFLAGLGNIYANEALWRAGIHPERIAGSLSEDEIRALHSAITTTLTEAIVYGGTSLDDRQYVYPDGGLGEYQDRLRVYDRVGDRCPRCGAILERIVQGQRSTYLCPCCQSKDAS